MAAVAPEGGRRRRKNAQPRSISHVMTVDVTYEGDGDEDDSSAVTWFTSANHITSPTALPVTQSAAEDAALDLTVKSSSARAPTKDSVTEVTIDEHGVLDLTSHKRHDEDGERKGKWAREERVGDPGKGPWQQEIFGDSAMNELLSPYGLDLNYTGPSSQTGQQQRLAYMQVPSSPVAQDDQDQYSLSYSSSEGASGHVMDSEEQPAALTLTKSSPFTHKVINSVHRLVKSPHGESHEI